MWANYLGLWLLFLFFLALTIAIYYYSRWQIKGPIFKMKWRNFKRWILRKDKGQVKVKKGSTVIDQRILDEIERTKTAAEAAQDHLKAQNLEHQLEKEKEQALKDYEDKSKGKSKNIFKSKSKNDAATEEVTDGTSILDELGAGNSAQDLLHQVGQEKEIVENEPNKDETILKSIDKKEN